MEESTSREKVLKKIRNALISKHDNPYPSLDNDSSVYHELNDSLDITFAQEFTKVAGKFVYCETQSDLENNLITLIGDKKWKNIFCLEPGIKKMLEQAGIPYQSEETDFQNAEVGITYCEYLIARFGSIMISSKQASGRRLNVFPEYHIVIAYSSQIVRELKDALVKIMDEYKGKTPSFISIITGPSRTADIEKTLVMGAHGPKDLYVFLIDEN
ncbi:MAG: LUD domain-containing protein [Bacteroidales bacterium]|nr:LUD domain-containing protein [Bacteroidales bacterium]